MDREIVRLAFLFVILIGLSSWGEKVHRKINTACVEVLPSKLDKMKTWIPILAEHSVDPDKRRKTDKNEFVRHFIDLDNYSGFLKDGKIEEDFNIICQKYSREMVMKNGTLPWVTDSTYKALVSNFKTKDFGRAALTAADLGHYVADGFMPLHTSANYDGQLSNQKGIHSRFEEKMINQHIDNIEIKISGVDKIKNTSNYIFGYLYKNFECVDDLLLADSISYEYSGKNYNATYYDRMWNESEVFTTNLINSAAQKVASLIYKAWLEAGKPQIQELKPSDLTN